LHYPVHVIKFKVKNNVQNLKKNYVKVIRSSLHCNEILTDTSIRVEIWSFIFCLLLPSSHSLMMEAENGSETMHFYSISLQLIAQEYLVAN